LRNDVDRFETAEFSLIIADEAQHVKNRRTHAARALRAAKAPGRFVLTGTPVENSMEDLRSLFAFCLPGYLRKLPRDIRGEERDWYDRRHRGKAAPYILRRGKREVAPELPEKIEQVLWVDLSPEQRALYERWQRSSEEEMMKLASSNVSENRLRFALLTQLLRLRQICAEPIPACSWRTFPLRPRPSMPLFANCSLRRWTAGTAFLFSRSSCDS
jgi:SNF2 family DNA or RNA helicase